MTSMRRNGVVASAILALALLGAGAQPAHAAEVLAPDGPASVEVRVIGPGHDVEWSMGARNVAASPVAPTFEVTNVTGDIFAGDTPATITLTNGNDVLYQRQVADVVGTVFGVDEVDPGESISLGASVLLPSEAGDEYRTAAGVVDWKFSAFVSGEPTPTPAEPRFRQTRPALPTCPPPAVPTSFG
ncbi:hypothetical protein PQI23_09235 [Leucobacter sp. USCH14]|uniref:hypothetical protein n=1 Tax=Leucobacter sp. USCH14 TaxID=3024838 RepID=UPI0030A01BBB